MVPVHVVEGEGGGRLVLQPRDVLGDDLLGTGAGLGLLGSPPSSPLLHVFLHFLEISFKFGPSVLEPRYHLIKKPGDYVCYGEGRHDKTAGQHFSVYKAGGRMSHLSSGQPQCGGDLVSVRW